MANWNLPVAKQLHSVSARYEDGRDSSRPLAGRARTFNRNQAFWCEERDGSTDGSGARRDARLTRLEAILLLAREPLSTRKLSQYANLADGTEARTLIRQLNERYDQSGRSFRVEEVAGGFQLLTRPKFASWLRRLEHVPKETRLSAPAMETLAVIAYCQPAGRAEIEAIRGVNCGEMLKQLMDRELVKIAGRSDDLGRPYLYATTRRFLQLFGLKNLDELPRAAQLKKNLSRTSKTEVPITNNASDSPERIEEEPDVTVTIRAEQSPEELKKLRAGNLTVISPRAVDEDDDDMDDTDDAEDDEDDMDDDDDLEDEEFDDVDDEDLDDFDDEEDDEWEEVEDDDEEDDEEWEEDDDDDWDEDEEEEEDEKEEDWE